MSNALGVGLHIIYGRMGAGKTNFAINEILVNTTYKKCILNVPLFPEFQEKLGIEFELYKKLEPDKVIRQIDESHQDTLFIIDESQMVLMSANKLLVDSFCKKMSQIRQNNQCVVVIAQISKMLPNTIKDLAESCYFFENNNVRGVEKSSKVKHYRTGYDYTTRLIETFTYIHVYGTYESTNTPTTEKPKNLYKRTYIRLAFIFGGAVLLFAFVGWKFYSFLNKENSPLSSEQTSSFVHTEQINSFVQDKQVNDSLCVRSWNYLSHGIVKAMFNDGQMDYLPIGQFHEYRKCSLK